MSYFLLDYSLSSCFSCDGLGSMFVRSGKLCRQEGRWAHDYQALVGTSSHGSAPVLSIGEDKVVRRSELIYMQLLKKKRYREMAYIGLGKKFVWFFFP